MRLSSLITPSTQFLNNAAVLVGLTIYSRTTTGSPALPENWKINLEYPLGCRSLEMMIGFWYAALANDGARIRMRRIKIGISLP
jgi:hypothetical protein